jgi:hypothetical protein
VISSQQHRAQLRSFDQQIEGQDQNRDEPEHPPDHADDRSEHRAEGFGAAGDRGVLHGFLQREALLQ